MLFTKRQDYTPSQSSLALGQTVRFELTREFHIERIDLKIDVTVSGVMATPAAADRILDIVKRIKLSVSDGARTRTPIDCSGSAIIEIAKQWQGGLDRRTTLAIGGNSATTYNITYPIYFAHPQLADPAGSTFLLPAPRFNNNPVIEVQFASQADMDSNGAPTFAVSSLAARCLVVRRQVTKVNWPTFDTELVELEQAYPTTGNNQLYELQVPGSYTGLLLRCYTAAATRGDVMVANGEFKLQLLGTVLRRFRTLDLQDENDSSKFNPTAAQDFVGGYYLDFLTDKSGQSSADLGSVLDANILSASGARVQLLQDITGGAGVKIKYLSHRVFGDLSKLKMG
jgi:hypothetical protein